MKFPCLVMKQEIAWTILVSAIFKMAAMIFKLASFFVMLIYMGFSFSWGYCFDFFFKYSINIRSNKESDLTYIHTMCALDTYYKCFIGLKEQIFGVVAAVYSTSTYKEFSLHDAAIDGKKCSIWNPNPAIFPPALPEW